MRGYIQRCRRPECTEARKFFRGKEFSPALSQAEQAHRSFRVVQAYIFSPHMPPRNRFTCCMTVLDLPAAQYSPNVPSFRSEMSMPPRLSLFQAVTSRCPSSAALRTYCRQVAAVLRQVFMSKPPSGVKVSPSMITDVAFPQNFPRRYRRLQAWSLAALPSLPEYRA